MVLPIQNGSFEIIALYKLVIEVIYRNGNVVALTWTSTRTRDFGSNFSSTAVRHIQRKNTWLTSITARGYRIGSMSVYLVTHCKVHNLEAKNREEKPPRVSALEPGLISSFHRGYNIQIQMNTHKLNWRTDKCWTIILNQISNGPLNGQAKRLKIATWFRRTLISRWKLDNTFKKTSKEKPKEEVAWALK